MSILVTGHNGYIGSVAVDVLVAAGPTVVGLDAFHFADSSIGKDARETLPSLSVEYAPEGEPDRRSYRVDFAKFARTFPEFHPLWDARKGAAQILEAFPTWGLADGEFPTKFTCIATLAALLRGNALGPDLRWRDA